MELVNKGKKPIYIQDVNFGISYNRTMLSPIYIDKDLFYSMTGQKSVIPFDNYIGCNMMPFKMTLSMMSRIASTSINSKSFADASKNLKNAGYKIVSTSIVDQVCNVTGQAILNYYQMRADEVKSRIESGNKIGPHNVDIHTIDSLNPEKVLILMVDGHTIYLRRYSTGKYGIDDGGKCGNDCRVGIAFKLADATVLPDENGGETVHINKMDITALIGPKDQYKYFFGDLALRNGADECDLIVVVSDGADWLHKMTKELFNSCLHIRDLWHVKECIGEYCKALFPDDSEKAERFANELCTLIEEGKITQYLERLEPYKDYNIIVNGTKLVHPYSYVAGRRDGMEYDLYRSLGLPVGSGIIESKNKAFHRRMRTTGSLWTKSTANRMVMIIAVIESGGEDKILEILTIMKEKLLKIADDLGYNDIHRKYKKRERNH